LEDQTHLKGNRPTTHVCIFVAEPTKQAILPNTRGSKEATLKCKVAQKTSDEKRGNLKTPEALQDPQQKKKFSRHTLSSN
jgi:hypothetical protein